MRGSFFTLPGISLSGRAILLVPPVAVINNIIIIMIINHITINTDVVMRRVNRLTAVVLPPVRGDRKRITLPPGRSVFLLAHSSFLPSNYVRQLRSIIKYWKIEAVAVEEI